VARVEQAIVDHYATLQLPANFADEVRQRLEDALADEPGSVRELHNSLTRRLKELDQRESRLIDLVADDTMPTAKIRAKLHEVKVDRARIEVGLTSTSEELSEGAGVLRDALHLLTDPQELYANVSNRVRRHLNQTFFHKFYLDDLEVIDDQLSPLFAEVHHAKEAFVANQIGSYQRQESPRKTGALNYPKTDLLTLASVFSDKGSSKTVMVGRAGLEPATNGIPTPRSGQFRLLPVFCCATRRLVV
jgi:site-specific DNA recombinase